MVKADAAKKKKPTNGAVLRLTTRADEHIGYVAVDDTTYELANPSHFGLREGGAVWRAMARITELETMAEADGFEASPEQEKEYRDRLLQVAAKALPDAPRSALEKLTAGSLADLAVHFFAEAARTNPRLSMIVRAAK